MRYLKYVLVTAMTGSAMLLYAQATPTSKDRPLFSAVIMFCADTAAKPDAVKAAVERAGGKPRSPLGASAASWDVTLYDHPMVVSVAALPSGDSCEVDSATGDIDSLDTIGAWSGVGRFDRYDNGPRAMYHAQYQVRGDYNTGYANMSERDAAMTEGRLWDLTLVRDHNAASATLIRIVR